MRFTWINWFNGAAVCILLLLNLPVFRKGSADRFGSRYPLLNVSEQIGRYGCMALMILPLVRGLKFGFRSVLSMFLWLVLTLLLLAVYAVLRFFRAKGGKTVLKGLALVPPLLFLTDGILLRHPLLVLFALLFGVSHFLILLENEG